MIKYYHVMHQKCILHILFSVCLQQPKKNIVKRKCTKVLNNVLQTVK
jgi:hypothetical protein